MARKPTRSRVKEVSGWRCKAFPRCSLHRCEPRSAASAIGQTGGTWQAISWQAMSDNVRNIAKGWLALGLQMGDRVALLANSRAEWVQCDLGIMAAAGITVPVYPSAP